VEPNRTVLPGPDQAVTASNRRRSQGLPAETLGGNAALGPRTTIGVASLPGGQPAEVEITAIIEGDPSPLTNEC
jgi:hypothetical protein